MKFDQEKNNLVLHLRRLKSKKDQTEYKKFKLVLMKKYGVTERAVQKWLNRRNPGLRKSRNDAGKDRVKVIPKETKLVKELIQTGTDIKVMRKIVANKTGKPISTEKLAKIRTRIESKPEEPAEEIKKSGFGDKAKELFIKLFELDLIAPDHGIALKTGKDSFVIHKDDVADICLILANSYNRYQTDEGKKKKIDRELLRKQMILHLMEQQIRFTSETGSTQDVESLTRMYDRLREKFVRDANIRVVEKICKHLKPDIQFDEIVSLIDEYTEVI
jgi:hypothetical protein